MNMFNGKAGLPGSRLPVQRKYCPGVVCKHHALRGLPDAKQPPELPGNVPLYAFGLFFTRVPRYDQQQRQSDA